MSDVFSGGYIKLFRALSDHGHLQMPDACLKLFVYLLLNVNYKATRGCAPGEGWITYRMIREKCCDTTRPPWADSTISRTLDYLEGANVAGPDGQPELYIRRLKTKSGAPQRIRVLNWSKFQGNDEVSQALRSARPDSSEARPAIEPSAGVAKSALAPQEVSTISLPSAEHEESSSERQELIRSPLDRGQRTWIDHFQNAWPGQGPGLSYLERIMDAVASGFSEEAIIQLIGRAKENRTRRIYLPSNWLAQSVENLLAQGVKTASDLEEWAENWRHQAKGGQRRKGNAMDALDALIALVGGAQTP